MKKQYTKLYHFILMAFYSTLGLQNAMASAGLPEECPSTVAIEQALKDLQINTANTMNTNLRNKPTINVGREMVISNVFLALRRDNLNDQPFDRIVASQHADTHGKKYCAFKLYVGDEYSGELELEQ